MNADERLTMFVILHATCEMALEKLAGSIDGDRQIAADLKRVLERTGHELEALSWQRRSA